MPSAGKKIHIISHKQEFGHKKELGNKQEFGNKEEFGHKQEFGNKPHWIQTQARSWSQAKLNSDISFLEFRHKEDHHKQMLEHLVQDYYGHIDED